MGVPFKQAIIITAGHMNGCPGVCLWKNIARKYENSEDQIDVFTAENTPIFNVMIVTDAVLSFVKSWGSRTLFTL